MLNKKNIKIKVNHLKLMYMELSGLALTSDEMRNLMERDITEQLIYTIISIPSNKALVNIAIRGNVTVGKSSCAIALMKMVIDELIRMGKIPLKRGTKEYQDYLYQHIKSDQTEYLRFTLQNEQDTCVVIDEFSSLAETGLNATTEMAMYDENSNLFAQRFVHKISCSPGYIRDKNTEIILDVIGKDVEHQLTEVKVSYRDVVTKIPHTLGVAYIDVSKVINEEFYKRYRKKKFERMSLLDTHGIRDVRDMEFATIEKEAYQELEKGTEIKKFTEGSILPVVDAVRRRNKMQYSLLTLNYVVITVKSLLDLKYEINRLQKGINAARSTEIEKQYKELQQIFQTILTNSLKDINTKIQVYKDYKAII